MAAVLVSAAMLAGLTACGQTQAAAQEEVQQEETQAESAHMDLQDMDLKSILNLTGNYILASTPDPTCSSVAGEWAVFGLARWGEEIPAEWMDTYYNNLCAYVEECGGVLHERKYTEYSRVILALTAIGKDPTNVNGHNLLIPLADYEATIFQGVNGAAFALLALDGRHYEIPVNEAGTTQSTRDMYVDYILSQEAEGGGWGLTQDAVDVDVTAMVLQALAKYQGREDVAEAVERGIEVLSSLQNENGGYTAYEAESSESIAQVIVALTELGINLDDERFVKDGHTLLGRLMEYQTEEGGFKHVLDGEADPMATEQAFYALVAAYLKAQGLSSLYMMGVVV